MMLEGAVYINYIKLIACILIILSSTGIGMYMGSWYRWEIKELKEFKKIIMLLKGEISYGNMALPEAIEILASKNEGNFSEFLLVMAQELKLGQGVRFQVIWENAIASTFANVKLSNKDKEMIKGLGRDLGHMDKHTQIECLDVFLYEIDEEIKDKTIMAKDKVRIYNTTGILFGVFVVIILA